LDRAIFVDNGFFVDFPATHYAFSDTDMLFSSGGSIQPQPTQKSPEYWKIYPKMRTPIAETSSAPAEIDPDPGNAAKSRNPAATTPCRTPKCVSVLDEIDGNENCNVTETENTWKIASDMAIQVPEESLSPPENPRIRFKITKTRTINAAAVSGNPRCNPRDLEADRIRSDRIQKAKK
jgi:hypothetical protein